ncbi:S-methyl-5'-thioadenosine phosphorylase [Propionibacteriaceae bacterium Y1685]|uniref:S-methyl-5'-thioadenosine phosphorylase n=1 Tax=Microlunatus sp. Y1700 TaxID=3418487 RepID=UPI003B7F8E49
MTSTTQAGIGVIGGTGFYSFLTDPTEVTVSTPYGDPSGPVTVGEVNGRAVAFLPRHGVDHQFPPHKVNYRANLWALRSVGVRQVLTPCAVGSLKPEITPGTFVVPDQVVDRTWGRAHTFFDEVGAVVHVGLADPYCPHGRAALLAAIGEGAVDGGTLVVVNGPRFSTRAESQWHAAQGWSVVGMTGMPETALARELGLCCSTVAVATDHDAGVEGGEAVSHREVMKIFGANIERLKSVLSAVITALPDDQPDDAATCSCRRALDGQRLPLALP